MKKIIAVFFILMLLTGWGEQPVDVEQTAEPPAVPTPVPTEFVPAPLEPAELTQEQWEKMRTSTQTIIKNDGTKISRTQGLLGFEFVDYFGTYNGYIALRLHNYNLPMTENETVAGYTLYYAGVTDDLYGRVLLWKENVFYHLKYAYEQNWLTEGDIKTIAYYNNKGRMVPAEPITTPKDAIPLPEDFVPAPIEPTELSEELWTKIMQTDECVAYGERFRFPALKHMNSTFIRYYGTYQGYIAIYAISETLYGGPSRGYNIAGVRFDNSVAWGFWMYRTVLLWKDDLFYQLEDAYQLGLITVENIQNIAYYANNDSYDDVLWQ